MNIYQDSRTSKWYYRFKRYGRQFYEGGFERKAEADMARAKALAQAIREHINPEERGRNLTFGEAGTWWLETYAPTKRSKTNDHARIGLMVKFFDKIRIRDLQPERIEEFLSRLPELRGRSVGPHTRNHYLGMLKALINRLKRKRLYTGENPAEYVDMLKVPRVRVRFLYPAEEKALSPVVEKNPDVWAYYFTGLHTGMRITELRKIRVKDVDLLLSNIFVPQAKNNRSRYVPMSEELAEAMTAWIRGKAADDFVLPHWSYQYVLRTFQEMCAEIGIEDVTPHVWRHTFAQRLLAKGESIYKVSKILGHSSIKVTEEHYGHLATADLADAVTKINGVVTRCFSDVSAKAAEQKPAA